MKNKKIYLALFLLISIIAKVQSQSDYHSIQNYRSDAVLVVNTQNYSSVFLSEYGSIKIYTGPIFKNYLFQNQEYDTDLNLVLFPSRLYSPKEKRFFQPDPKSQYFSPYLFVGADPVNIVDKDGNEGKSLILHGVEDGKQIETGVSNESAYDYTLSDFIQHKIPDLPEWNGNVYVTAHMSGKGRIIVETSKDLPSENLLAEKGVIKKTLSSVGEGATNATSSINIALEGASFGERIKQFSVANKIRLKNVVMAGCEGEVAAKKAVSGFDEVSSPGLWRGRGVNFFGTKKGYAVAELQTSKRTSWQWMPKKSKISTSREGDLRFKGKDYPVFTYTPKGSSEALPAMAKPDESVATDLLIQGRIPPNAETFVSHIPTAY